MTKEEKIKEAWGEYYNDISHEFMNNNGGIYAGYIEREKAYLLDSIELDKVSALEYRPKSLQGIENNNGWIRIESEDDLPKDVMTNYFICVDGKPSIHVHNLRQVLSLFKDGMVSHYQPIVKPKNPIY